MTKSFFLLLGFLALVPCLTSTHADVTTGPDASAGIEGTISASPAHAGPVHQEEPAAVPLANMAFEVKQADKVISSFVTDSQGHFKVLLPPGHYTISRKDYQRAVGHYGPFEVTVTQGKMTSVHWECDTGLR